MPAKNDTRHTIIGCRHRASSRYAMIKSRITNTSTSRNSCYEGVRLIVGRDEFIEWFMQRDFAGCSVDRINKDGDYELSNMQVIPLWKNIAKDKVKARGGVCRCFACGEEKPLDQFVSDRRRITTGKTTICKHCESLRGSVKYKKQTELMRSTGK